MSGFRNKMMPIRLHQLLGSHLALIETMKKTLCVKILTMMRIGVSKIVLLGNGMGQGQVMPLAHLELIARNILEKYIKLAVNNVRNSDYEKK